MPRKKSARQLASEIDQIVSSPRPAPAGAFDHAFGAAFDRLDRDSGGNNYVLLHDLRRALPTVSREAFDAGLNQLRRAKVFSLDSADGRHVKLSEEQRDAGIREAGSNLVYAQRRERRY